MLPLGTYEIIVIVVVALVVVGPKDLPGVLRTVFRALRKAQAVTREFRRGLEDVARESGFDEIQKDLKKATGAAKGDFDSILGDDDAFNDRDLSGDKAGGPKNAKSIGEPAVPEISEPPAASKAEGTG